MTIFARNPDTGEAKWGYQMTPWDAWDYDGINEHILADINVGGQMKKVLVHFDRNGFAYTIDRTNGTLLVAEPFVFVNWATGIDKKTGRPIEVEAKRTKAGADTKDICPCAMGGKDQQPGAFSPRTNLVYVGTNNMCMNYEGVEVKYTAGAPYVGANVLMFPGRGGHLGEFMAWDPATGKKVWGIKEPQPAWSGALATAGDVVFYGTMDGWFKAVNAKTGELLWKHKLPSGTIGNPMTYHGSRRQAVRRDLLRSRRLVRASRGSRPPVQRPVRGVGRGGRRLRVGPRQGHDPGRLASRVRARVVSAELPAPGSSRPAPVASRRVLVKEER